MAMRSTLISARDHAETPDTVEDLNSTAAIRSIGMSSTPDGVARAQKVPAGLTNAQIAPGEEDDGHQQVRSLPMRRDVPLPRTDVELQAEHQRLLGPVTAESLAAGADQWEARVTFPSHHEAVALAGKLRSEAR
jgi:hypothetical protein